LEEGAIVAAGVRQATALITRSAVKPATRYQDYQEYLRWDFWFSCAYCDITEIEASGISFETDHYEPQSIRPDMAAVYSNLLWACRLCNRYKGAYCPSDEERAAGLRYFRPDLDDAYEHFEVSGLRVTGLSPVGRFTEVMLDLNRREMQEIRELRRDLFEAKEEILVGIRALNGISIDQLSPSIRAKFIQIRKRLQRNAATLTSNEDLLREFNRSPLLDKDPEAPEFPRQRREYLAALRALLPSNRGSKNEITEGLGVHR
jgi:hypothetical protein